MTFKDAVRLKKIGNYKKCLQAIRELEKRLKSRSGTESLNLRYLKADVFLDMKRYRDAVKCYENILDEQASDVAYANKGLALWELRRYRAALKSYQKAVKLNPRNEIAHQGIGEMHVKLGSPKAALPFLKRALKLRPSYQAAYTCMGMALYQLGAWVQAYRALQTALKLDPNDWQAKRGIEAMNKHFDL